MADDPKLIINEKAVEHLKEAFASWKGEPRDFAMACAAFAHAALLIIDGRTDQIAMIEAGAQALASWKKEGHLDG